MRLRAFPEAPPKRSDPRFLVPETDAVMNLHRIGAFLARDLLSDHNYDSRPEAHGYYLSAVEDGRKYKAGVDGERYNAEGRWSYTPAEDLSFTLTRSRLEQVRKVTIMWPQWPHDSKTFQFGDVVEPDNRPDLAACRDFVAVDLPEMVAQRRLFYATLTPNANYDAPKRREQALEEVLKENLTPEQFERVWAWSTPPSPQAVLEALAQTPEPLHSAVFSAANKDLADGVRKQLEAASGGQAERTQVLATVSGLTVPPVAGQAARSNSTATNATTASRS